MLPWKLRKRQFLSVNQNLLSVHFSLAKFQLVSRNLSLAMIWQMTCNHKLPKLCSATLIWLAFVHIEFLFWCFVFTCTVEPRFMDTRLIRTPRYYGYLHFLALNCSTRLIRAPVNADNGHLFLSCPISEFSQNANLANADTSLSTVCCNRPFLFEGKKILQLTACRCSQLYCTQDKMICRSPFLPSNELCREWTILKSLIRELKISPARCNDGFVKVKKV